MQKLAIVTGASGNLGRAVVEQFLTDGYKVIGTIIPNDSSKMDIADKNFEAITVDLSNESDSEKFITGLIQKHGTIDAAVLTAGGFAMGSIADTTTSDILQQYKLNFETAYNPTRFIFNQMIKQGTGRIFLIGSRPGLSAKNGKGMVAYSLSKSLLFHLAEMMNDEAKGKNVVTSVIVPSTIDTAANRKSMPDANPGNWVKASAIAEVIAFYCSDKAAVLREPVIKVYNNV